MANYNYSNHRPISDNQDNLAIAFVKNQQPQSPTYDLTNALLQGTIYIALDKPFLGKAGCNK